MPPHATDAVEKENGDLSVPVGVASSRDRNSPSKLFTFGEVSKHNTPEDCWLVIWGKVYDVSSWVPTHPGGALIYVKAGQDSTQLFDSYHPLYVRKMLAKYCVGELQRDESESKDYRSSIEFSDGDQEAFYLTVKQRVETYFRKRKINPRYHPLMFVKSAIIIAGYFTCYYIAFFVSRSLMLSILCACIVGICAAEVGVSIQHDANHGAYSQSSTFGYIMGATLDLVGASRARSSTILWYMMAVGVSFCIIAVIAREIIPHLNAGVSDPDIRRVTMEQPRRWYHRYQHIYLAILYSLLALKSVLIDDFSAYVSGSIGQVKVASMTPLEHRIFFGGKAFYFLYMYLLPPMFSRHSMLSIVGIYIVSQLVAGWMLALLFQVAHVVEDVDFPRVDDNGDRMSIRGGWAELQVRTTTNFSVRSPFWTQVSGGLNHQIEHHLFPSVCHLHYPSIQPIVKSTCDEFSVPYTAYPSYWAALKAHFGYLQKVGLQGGLRLDG